MALPAKYSTVEFIYTRKNDWQKEWNIQPNKKKSLTRTNLQYNSKKLIESENKALKYFLMTFCHAIGNTKPYLPTLVSI